MTTLTENGVPSAAVALSAAAQVEEDRSVIHRDVALARVGTTRQRAAKAATAKSRIVVHARTMNHYLVDKIAPWCGLFAAHLCKASANISIFRTGWRSDTCGEAAGAYFAVGG